MHNRIANFQSFKGHKFSVVANSRRPWITCLSLVCFYLTFIIFHCTILQFVTGLNKQRYYYYDTDKQMRLKQTCANVHIAEPQLPWLCTAEPMSKGRNASCSEIPQNLPSDIEQSYWSDSRFFKTLNTATFKYTTKAIPRPSHLKVPGGPKMTCAALSRTIDIGP